MNTYTLDVDAWLKYGGAKLKMVFGETLPASTMVG